MSSSSKFYQNLRVVNLITTSSCAVPNLPITDNSTKAANTNFVQSAIAAIEPPLNLLETNNNWIGTNNFENNITVPTQATNDNSENVANTEFVHNVVSTIPTPQSLLSSANTWTNGQTFNVGSSFLCGNNGTAAEFVATSGYANNGIYLQNIAINQENINQPNFSNTFVGFQIKEPNSTITLFPNVDLKFNANSNPNNLSYVLASSNENFGISYFNQSVSPSISTPLLEFTSSTVQCPLSIPSNDSSSKLATTQWVNNAIASIPVTSNIASYTFNGYTYLDENNNWYFFVYCNAKNNPDSFYILATNGTNAPTQGLVAIPQSQTLAPPSNTDTYSWSQASFPFGSSDPIIPLTTVWSSNFFPGICTFIFSAFNFYDRYYITLPTANSICSQYETIQWTMTNLSSIPVIIECQESEFLVLQGSNGGSIKDIILNPQNTVVLTAIGSSSQPPYFATLSLPNVSGWIGVSFYP
jgi:hypothetical protein